MDIVVLYLIVNRNFLLETDFIFWKICVLHFDMYFLMYLILESQNNDYRYNMAVI